MQTNHERQQQPCGRNHTYPHYGPQHPPYVFFFNDTATTEIYTLSLHDALPILERERLRLLPWASHPTVTHDARQGGDDPDRKSTRLNSSHSQISYAVFCLKKKKIEPNHERHTQPYCRQHNYHHYRPHRPPYDTP